MQQTLKKAAIASGVAAAVAVMALTGCKTSDTSDRSAGRQMDDKNINENVEEALEDSQQYKFPEVRVMTYGGVVQLSGFVDTEEQKRKAAEIASRIEGVHEVINGLALKHTPTGQATGYPQPETKLDASPPPTNKVDVPGAPIRELK